jgi:hypothetical protein
VGSRGIAYELSAAGEAGERMKRLVGKKGAEELWQRG